MLTQKDNHVTDGRLSYCNSRRWDRSVWAWPSANGVILAQTIDTQKNGVAESAHLLRWSIERRCAGGVKNEADSGNGGE